MKLTLPQTKLVGLSMQLDLKTKEYHSLCKQLDDLQKSHTDPNAPEYVELLKKFQTNLKDIKTITDELKKLNEEQN